MVNLLFDEFAISANVRCERVKAAKKPLARLEEVSAERRHPISQGTTHTQPRTT